MPENKEKLDYSLRVPSRTYEELAGKCFISKERVDNTGSRALAPDSGHFSTDLMALDEKVKAMMKKSQNMISNNQVNANGAPNRTKAMICKVCQKQGLPSQIRNHVEANQLEGIVIPCNFCDKVLSSRNSLENHKSMKHKNLK